jgi:ADP-heptose:LPS heptosyltransferase
MRPQMLARKLADGSWTFSAQGSVAPQSVVSASADFQISASLLSDQSFQPQTILLIRPDSIGDLVIMSSILSDLDKRFPQSRIVLVCQAHIAPLFTHCPYIDSVFSFDKQLLNSSEEYQIQVTTALQKMKPDLAINGVVSPDPIAHLLTLASNSRVTVGVVGDTVNIETQVQKRIEDQYTFLVSRPIPSSEITNHRILLENLGVKSTVLKPQIWFAGDEENFIDTYFAEHGLVPEKTLIVFAVGQFAEKNYADFGMAVRDFCQRNSWSVLALGDLKASELNQYICASSGVKAVNASGKFTLLQSAMAIKKSAMCLGIDTGLAHIACALNKPNVIVMGGGHFGRFMPYSQATSLVCLPLSCYGCNWHCRHQRIHCVQDIHPNTIERALSDAQRSRSEKPRIYLQQRLQDSCSTSYQSPEFFIDQDVEYILV